MEIKRYFPFKPRRLAIGQFATSPAERGAEIVIEIKIFNSFVAVLA
jgi:hypothetical protein